MSPEGPETSELQWRKARRSANNGACIELAPANGQIAVRDSKNPGGTWLRYSAQSWREFIGTIKAEQIFQ
jgi:hypothetical protein